MYANKISLGSKTRTALLPTSLSSKGVSEAFIFQASFPHSLLKIRDESTSRSSVCCTTLTLLKADILITIQSLQEEKHYVLSMSQQAQTLKKKLLKKEKSSPNIFSTPGRNPKQIKLC